MLFLFAWMSKRSGRTAAGGVGTASQERAAQRAVVVINDLEGAAHPAPRPR